MKGLVAGLLVLAGAQACAGNHNCTLVGGHDGIAITIPGHMYLDSETAAVKVCDDSGCVSTTEKLPSQGNDATVSHGIDVGYRALGRRPAPGQVQVTVTLTDARGRVVAAAVHDVELTLLFPNGRGCDGDGFLGGQLDMRARDRV